MWSALAGFNTIGSGKLNSDYYPIISSKAIVILDRDWYSMVNQQRASERSSLDLRRSSISSSLLSDTVIKWGLVCGLLAPTRPFGVDETTRVTGELFMVASWCFSWPQSGFFCSRKKNNLNCSIKELNTVSIFLFHFLNAKFLLSNFNFFHLSKCFLLIGFLRFFFEKSNC